MPHLELTDDEVARIAEAVAQRLQMQPAAVRDDTFLTERQVAAMTGLGIRALQKRRAANRPPRFVKFGRAVRYRREDVAAAMVSSEP